MYVVDKSIRLELSWDIYSKYIIIILGFRVKPLRPFVKIDCQEVFVQTVTAVGCHPAWNQTLPLKIK